MNPDHAWFLQARSDLEAAKILEKARADFVAKKTASTLGIARQDTGSGMPFGRAAGVKVYDLLDRILGCEGF